MIVEDRYLLFEQRVKQANKILKERYKHFTKEIEEKYKIKMNIIENDYNEIVAMNERLTQTILKFNVSKIKW